MHWKRSNPSLRDAFRERERERERQPDKQRQRETERQRQREIEIDTCLEPLIIATHTVTDIV